MEYNLKQIAVSVNVRSAFAGKFKKGICYIIHAYTMSNKRQDINNAGRLTVSLLIIESRTYRTIYITYKNI